MLYTYTERSVECRILIDELIQTCEIQVVGGVNDNAHQGQVEGGHLRSDLTLDAAMVQIVRAQQAEDGVDGLPLDLSPEDARSQTTKPLRIS